MKQQVIELRVVVQRVDEGPTLRVYPKAITARQVTGFRAQLSASDIGRPSSTGITTTGVFPSFSDGEARFAPKLVVHTRNGRGAEGVSEAKGGNGHRVSSPAATASAAMAAATAAPSLGLYEYATVDFFIEAAGCPTESAFLDREACVDVRVSAVDEAVPNLRVIPVALTERPRAAAAGLAMRSVGVRQVKRRA